MIVFVTGIRTGQYEQVRGGGIASFVRDPYSLILFLLFYVRLPYPPPDTLVPIVATTQGHFPTHAFLVYDPAFRLPDLSLPSPGSHYITPSPFCLLLLSFCASSKVS